MKRSWLAFFAVAVAACSFDWDDFDPRRGAPVSRGGAAGEGGIAAQGGSTGGDGAGGAGGAIGGAVGECDGRADGTPCGDQASSTCDAPDSCAAGSCAPNFAAAATACGDPSDVDCTDPDSCDGSGSCVSHDAADGTSCDDCGQAVCAGCATGSCPGGCSTAAPLSTTLAGGIPFDGNMFDVVAQQTIVITSLDVHLDAGMHDVEVYYRAGGAAGFQGDATAWTLAGSATGVSGAGIGVLTPVPIALSLIIPAGQTYGLYVTTLGSDVQYTTGTAVGTIAAQSASLHILEGWGVIYPFGMIYQPRIWNGAIHYDSCP